MPDRPEAYEILIRLDERVENMHKALLGGEGQQGRIPKVEETVEEHAAQIHQWTGSIKVGAWIVGVILTLFGGVLVTHILSDANPHNVVVIHDADAKKAHPPTNSGLTP